MGTDVEGLRRYLEALDQAVYIYISGVLTGAVGLLGVRGISSSGIVAQNFVLGPYSVGTNPLQIRLPNTEPDPSYLLFIQTNMPATFQVATWAQATTYVNLTFSGAPPAGAQVHVLLLR